jgi:putative DNA primase/helicase
MISEVGVDALCGRLARCADYFFKLSASGDEYNFPPPPGMVKGILALTPGEWKFQSLDAVTEIPIIRPNGSILDVPGYDPAMRLYYTPDPNILLPTLVRFISAAVPRIALPAGSLRRSTRHGR